MNNNYYSFYTNNKPLLESRSTTIKFCDFKNYFDFFKNIKLGKECFSTNWENMYKTFEKIKIKNTHNSSIIYYKVRIYESERICKGIYDKINIIDKILISSFKDLSCFINNE